MWVWGIHNVGDESFSIQTTIFGLPLELLISNDYFPNLVVVIEHFTVIQHTSQNLIEKKWK